MTPFDSTLLVVGTAPCVMDDLSTASAMRKNRVLMAVNYAAGMVAADLLFSIHAEMMGKFRQLQSPFQTHFTAHSDITRKVDGAPVDYYWRGLHQGATSGIAAAHVGVLMGFPEVILCGCPLTGFDGYACPSIPHPEVWFRKSSIEHHQAAAKSFSNKVKSVFSVSGFTRSIFGAPL